MIAFKLFAHIMKCIQRTTFIKFIDGDHIGIIEHVDLLQLGGGAVFRRHYIQAYIAIIKDAHIALSNPGRFQNNEIKGGFFTHIDGILYVFAQRYIALAGSEGAHISPGRMDTVHPDAVTQQGAPGFLFRGINRNNRNCFFGKGIQVPPNDLIGNG
jgi:hypothetical protein